MVDRAGKGRYRYLTLFGGGGLVFLGLWELCRKTKKLGNRLSSLLSVKRGEEDRTGVDGMLCHRGRRPLPKRPFDGRRSTCS